MRVSNSPTMVLIFVSVLACNQHGLADEHEPRSGVIKITSTQRSPNFVYPWQQTQASLSIGTGVVIDGHRILTNSHLVENATQVNVQTSTSPGFIPATVEHLAIDADLAILTVQQPDFWKELSSFPIKARALAPRDTVTLCGFSQGGVGLSFTEGTVTRTEFNPVGAFGLFVEVDASGKPGGSGGPALVNGEVAGLVFGMSGDQNSTFLIPSEALVRFLEDIEDGDYRGKGEFREDAQTLINPQLRKQYGVPPDVTGLLIRRPFRETADYPLKKGDIVTEVDGTPLGNDGTVRLTDGSRLSAQSLFSRNLQRDSIPVRLLREGNAISIEYELRTEDDSLIQGLDGELPSYYIWGPLAFTPASREFLAVAEMANPSLPRSWAYRESPLVVRRSDARAFDGEQLVVLNMLFPHAISNGYANPSGQVVERVNGKKVRNFRHLIRLLGEAETGRATFEFYELGSEILVFDRQQARSVEQQIQIENGIRSFHSPDLTELLAELAEK